MHNSEIAAAELENLRARIKELEIEREDLEALLETTTEHATVMENELFEKNEALSASLLELQQTQVKLVESENLAQNYLRIAQREFEVGRNIQLDFLPSSMPVLENWKLDARFKPAREVAGDFYDMFSLGPNLVGLVIADVCDKGVGAALFMALTRSMVRVLAQQSTSRLNYNLPNPQTRLLIELKDPTTHAVNLVLPAEVYEILNSVALTNTYITTNHRSTNMFATLFLGVLDTQSGSFHFVNAGHDAPIHWGTGGVKGRLNLTGPAVGVVPRAKYKIGYCQFEPGDSLLMYTDGVPEARDPANNFFTEKRLLEFIEEAQRSGEAQLLDALGASLKSHIAEAEPYDDITMVWLQRQLAVSAEIAPVTST